MKFILRINTLLLLLVSIALILPSCSTQKSREDISPLKKTGEIVKAGEAIAIIGNTGTLSDGPHLHFELWYRGKAINPTDYVIF